MTALAHAATTLARPPRAAVWGLSLLLAGGWSATASADASVQKHQKQHKEQKQKRGKVEEGLASWYGPGFHGKATASGEIYDMHALTAAHRTLPLGTLVEVRNLENGRTAVARVNDRGPMSRHRIIDLSLGAAEALGIDRSGVARVRLTVIGSPGTPPPLHYWVQVGSFRDQDNARALEARLERRYPGTAISEEHGWYAVRVPSGRKRKAAEALQRDLERAGYETLVVPQPRSNT